MILAPQTGPRAAHALSGARGTARPQDRVPPFTILERQVVRLGYSLNEPAVLLRRGPPGFGKRLRRLIFGAAARTRLASDRLEALRAMAAALRRHPAGPDLEVTRAFFAAGWTLGHIELIRALCPARGPQHGAMAGPPREGAAKPIVDQPAAYHLDLTTSIRASR
jgi:hypothetical protein